MNDMTEAQRKCVYVIGAGFSKGLGYPLTNEILVQLWDRIKTDPLFKEDLGRIIRFHHPRFDCCEPDSFPNVEELLSELVVNEELYTSSRLHPGNFTKDDLQRLHQTLLLKIFGWFHEISAKTNLGNPSVHWLKTFCDRVRCKKAVIISFNWDLVLDELLFGNQVDDKSYGLSEAQTEGPVLLKPHGSLNWFEGDLGQSLKENKKVLLCGEDQNAPVYAFQRFRTPVSENNRTYTPLIVPPIYLKSFDKPVFEKLWRKCTSHLSTAKRVFFLGYSLPVADYHARFILRCGFHNQYEGELDKCNRRKKPTGPAEVVIVNPNHEAVRRIKESFPPGNKCRWFATTIDDADLRWDLPSLGLHPDHSKT